MSYKAPVREMQFVMNELLDFPAHYQSLPEGENATPDVVDATLEEAIANDTSETEFYRAKLLTAKFYFSKLLPRTASLELTIHSGAESLMEMEEAAFSL